MGLTILDAGVVIGFLDRNDAHHDRAHAVLREAADRNDELVLPASAFAEALVGPSRRGGDAIARFVTMVERVPIAIAPLDQDIAASAAELRAQHRSLKLPDALVIATAHLLDADVLVTSDRRWPPRGRLGLRATITKL